MKHLKTFEETVNAKYKTGDYVLLSDINKKYSNRVLKFFPYKDFAIITDSIIRMGDQMPMYGITYLDPSNNYINKLGIAGPNKSYGFVRAFVIKSTTAESVTTNTVNMIYNYDVNGVKGQHMKEGLIVSVTYSAGGEGGTEVGEITHTIKQDNLVHK